MSIFLGALSIIFIAFARNNKKFYFDTGLCLLMFILLLVINDNKFLDFFYFCFALGITQILLALLINFKDYRLKNDNFYKRRTFE